MFKKKPTVSYFSSAHIFVPYVDTLTKAQIKNLAPLRSSDRRKIADQIINEYKITIPSSEPNPDDSTPPATSNTTPPNLSAVRNSILPESSLSGRITTTTGPDLKEIQGTVYVGKHAGAEERVLWFKFEHGPGADRRLYPTVYTLWHNPNLVPLLYTGEVVMRKLHGGADLMTPGLANEPPFPERAVKGAVAAVAGVDRYTVPLWVGVCEIDVSALGEVQGTRGHAVKGLHWEGDELWAWSSSSRPGQPAPEYLQGWDVEAEGEAGDGVDQGVSELTLGDKNVQAKEAGEELAGEAPEEQSEEAPVEEEKEPTTKGKPRDVISLPVY